VSCFRPRPAGVGDGGGARAHHHSYQGDAGTADLFTEVSRGLDKALWFLESHLQQEGAGRG